MYFHVRRDTIEAYNHPETATPGHKLFAEWCRRGLVDEKFRSRFKAIGFIDNFKDLGEQEKAAKKKSFLLEECIQRRDRRFFFYRTNFWFLSPSSCVFLEGMPMMLEPYNGKPTLIAKSGTLVKGAVRSCLPLVSSTLLEARGPILFFFFLTNNLSALSLGLPAILGIAFSSPIFCLFSSSVLLLRMLRTFHTWKWASMCTISPSCPSGPSTR